MNNNNNYYQNSSNYNQSNNSKYNDIRMCKYCNGKIEEGKKFCTACGKPVDEGLQNDYPGMEYENNQKQKSKVYLYIIIASLVIVLCVLAVVSVLIMTNSKSSHNKEVKQAPIQIETQKPKPTEKNAENEEIEFKIAQIKEDYYKIQNSVDGYTFVNVDGYDVFYDSNKEFSKVNFVFSDEYNASYYFKDKELFFVFLYDGTKENRFYISDDEIIRWIDEDGNITEYGKDEELKKWEKEILKTYGGVLEKIEKAYGMKNSDMQGEKVNSLGLIAGKNISQLNQNPQYYRIDDYTHSYYCYVPQNFEILGETANTVSLMADDNTAKMSVTAINNENSYTAENRMNEYIRQTGGVVAYKIAKDDWYAVSIEKDGISYYKKGFTDHYIREMEFVFPEEYIDVYSEYIEYIEDNFKRTDK